MLRGHHMLYEAVDMTARYHSLYGSQQYSCIVVREGQLSYLVHGKSLRHIFHVRGGAKQRYAVAIRCEEEATIRRSMVQVVPEIVPRL